MGSIDNNHKVELEEEAKYLHAMKLASLVALPMSMKAAIELDLLEIIRRAGPGAQLSPAQIASQLPTNNPHAAAMLDRILMLLASHSVLTCSVITTGGGAPVQRSYGLAPVCDFFTNNQDGVSVAPLHLHLNHKPVVEAWHCLKDAVLKGPEIFQKAHGMSLFEYFVIDAHSSNIFNEAMFSHSILFMNKLLETSYSGFEGLKSLVDVGGGKGAVLSMITSKYPHIKGVNYDLPHVISVSPSYPGVEHVAGDMFDSVPSGDAIFMKWILHAWSDELCLKLLRNCWRALPDCGKVIVVELLLPATPETNISAQLSYHLDLVMVANAIGGKQRTKEDFEALAKEAGFFGFKVVCSIFNIWVMEFSK